MTRTLLLLTLFPLSAAGETPDARARVALALASARQVPAEPPVEPTPSFATAWTWRPSVNGDGRAYLYRGDELAGVWDGVTWRACINGTWQSPSRPPWMPASRGRVEYGGAANVGWSGAANCGPRG